MEVIGDLVMKKSKKACKAFDLDKAILEWSRQLRCNRFLEDGTIAELTAHLKDEVEDLIEQGKKPKDAFHEATESVESADVIGGEYYKTNSRGLFVALPGKPGGLSPALFLSSVKMAFRKMRRQKWYSLISITGLAVGITCSFLIFLWVRHEFSYDRFHNNADNIYRVIMEDHLSDGVSVHPWLPFPLGPALQNEFQRSQPPPGGVPTTWLFATRRRPIQKRIF